MKCPKCGKTDGVETIAEYVIQIPVAVKGGELEDRGSFSDGIMDFCLVPGAKALCPCGFTGTVELFSVGNLPCPIGVFAFQKEPLRVDQYAVLI